MIPLALAATKADSWRSLIMTFIVVFIVILIVYLFLARRRLRRPRSTYPFRRLSPELQFYSHLVNIELGHEPVKTKVVTKYFHEFLLLKYKLDPKEDLFSGVSEKETNPQTIELYGEIHSTLEALKNAPPDAIVNYVKELKKKINPAIHETVEKNGEEDCNTC